MTRLALLPFSRLLNGRTRTTTLTDDMAPLCVGARHAHDALLRAAAPPHCDYARRPTPSAVCTCRNTQENSVPGRPNSAASERFLNRPAIFYAVVLTAIRRFIRAVALKAIRKAQRESTKGQKG